MMVTSRPEKRLDFLRQGIFQVLILTCILTFVVWALITQRQTEEERFRFEALSRCRVLEVAIADVLHEGSAAQISLIQQRINRLVDSDSRIVRLSVIAMAEDGRYLHIASSLPSRIGKPAHAEDLEVISTGEIVYLEEEYKNIGALDITYPVHDFDGKVIALLGYTVSRELGTHRSAVMSGLGLLIFCLMLFYLWQARMLSRQNSNIQQSLRQQLETEESMRVMGENLHQARKMEAIGLLAGGVAHDLNNMLVGVVGIPDLMLQDGGLSPQQEERLVTIRETGIRISDVVSDMQVLSRSSAASWETIDLSQIVGEYLGSPEFQDKQQACQVRLETEIASGLPAVAGKSPHLRKVIMNLLVNAMEATGQQGMVGVRISEQTLTEPLKGYETIPAGKYVRLQVRDTGKGVDPEIIGRIFEPFFSRKVMGSSGTGLGLAICWSIVHDHGGYFDLNSSPSGTLFDVYLPVSSQDSVPREEGLSTSLLRSNGESVMVIDDDVVPRQVACDMLRSLGYHVLEAESGESAIATLEHRKVDLLLLDMIMDPGINGLETYRNILALHPGQKAVIVSGQAGTDDVDQAQQLGVGKFLKKPLSLQQLATAVAAELQQKIGI